MKKISLSNTIFKYICTGCIVKKYLHNKNIDINSCQILKNNILIVTNFLCELVKNNEYVNFINQLSKYEFIIL